MKISVQVKYFVLFLILSFTLYSRFLNLNWDKGYGFHPDEFNIAESVTRVDFIHNLDPNFYQYGVLPIYFLRAIGQTITFISGDNRYVTDIAIITIIGRVISAISSLFLVFLIYQFGKKIFSERAAVYAMFIIAFAPIFIQTAHFATLDNIITVLGILILGASWKIITSPTESNIHKAAILSGLSISIKLSAALFPVIPITALFLSKQIDKNNIWKKINILLYIILLISLVYFIFSPITFVLWDKYLNGLLYETGVVNGTFLVFYIYQFIGTIPYIYQLAQIPFTVGPVTTLLGFGGFLILLIKVRDKISRKYIVFLIFPIIYFLYTGNWFAKYVRYLLPFYPFLFLAAGFAVDKIIRKLKSFPRLLFLLIIIILPIIQGVAFLSIYQTPQTRIDALKWLNKNVPHNAKIFTEDAAEILPSVSRPGKIASRFPINSYPLFNPENNFGTLPTALSAASYIVIGTPRQMDVVISHPKQFPNLYRYYLKLRNGDLGFKQVAKFSSYPNISFGKIKIIIPDDVTEETFRVFDHPTVIIYKNVKGFSEAEIRRIL